MQEAATLLLATAETDTDPHTRITAMRTLASLGSQCTANAAKLLCTISNESATKQYRRTIADALIELGPRFYDRALSMLLAILADRSTDQNGRLWAAVSLIDLGPDQHSEAAQTLMIVSENPLADNWEREFALEKLAQLGDPHRSGAIAAMQRTTRDGNVDEYSRARAAASLVHLGTEFHPEASMTLLEIGQEGNDFVARLIAWRQLEGFAEHREQAQAELLELMSLRDLRHVGQLHISRMLRTDTIDLEVSVRQLREALHQSKRSITATIAAHSLAQLGYHLYDEVLPAAITLIDHIHHSGLVAWTRQFRDMPEPARERLAEIISSHYSSALRVQQWSAARAIRTLGFPGRDLHRHIAEDRLTPWAIRGAVVANLNDRHLVRALLNDLEATPSRSLIKDIDNAPVLLRAILANTDTSQRCRTFAADTLAELEPEGPERAISEFLQLIIDPFRQHEIYRLSARNLIAAEPGTFDEITNALSISLSNEREPTRDRVRCASTILLLDQQRAHEILHWVSELANRPTLTATERVDAVGVFIHLRATPPSTISGFLGALVCDPTVQGSERSTMARSLTGTARLDAARLVVADRALDIASRVLSPDMYGGIPCRDEVIAAIRDVFTAPERTAAERVEAANALVDLSPTFIPEATQAIADVPLRLAARADLGPAHRDTVLAAARRATDSTQAAHILLRLSPTDPHDAIDHLRQVTRDPRTADQLRIRLLFDLRQYDGLAPIRAIRDDPSSSDAVRWMAAMSLQDRHTDDRAAAARILKRLATTARPALRWRAAADLMTFGPRGREWGAEALQAIVDDETLPITARTGAARTLAIERPDTRRRMVRFLQDLPPSLPVLEARSEFEPTETVIALQALAKDADALTQVRAAEAMATTHRGYREVAAIIVRRVAHDGGVPWHVRLRAAGDLAKWSDLCLQEARDVITRLRS
ncbi:hypothetical protein JOD54_003365 [Actinokineospora baliensis]|uniref:hypothetical protein n=1 Tax=Actinokineospora baliensis TaxID=547056 RepID=UPI001956F723|nr:hypothetical protein [Actinokineospora baliensis]MBM7773161.1 hypothetical protein [Actinokineospora baliensis]